MADFESRDYRVFEMFRNNWAVVSAGDVQNFNGCTVSWGSIGTMWTRPESSGSVVTVYLHPARHTTKFFQENDKFTVSFFPEECKPALAYMGSHSGRNEDKAANAGLTPVDMNGTVGYAEAEMTLVCKKLYMHQLTKEDLAPEIQEYYKNNPKPYPVDENGEWQPHWVFVGDILEVVEK